MIFTSLLPTDIVVGENSSEGVRAFRGYLEYAAGGALVDDAVGGEPDSDFEVFVADQLRAVGYEVVPQVGVERFRIDLGVRHASYPLGFLAGIECDGAKYHSTLTVRGRDRIRQDVLEGLGWRIYRVWSTDWFNDREREIARLLRYLEEHRSREAACYESRRAAIEFAERLTPEVEQAAEPEAATASGEVAPPAGEQSAPEPIDDVETQVLISAPQPAGRKRSLDGIDYYEVQPGYYEVWIDGRMLGDVQRLSRAPVLGARLYGDRVVASITHYQATIAATNEVFNTDDIYRAVREVAHRAALSPVPTRHTQEQAAAATI